MVESPVPCHMLSACVGETFSCFFRIPFEVVKQKAQAGHGMNSRAAFLLILRNNGLTGFYQGIFSMVNREIPFTLIQFPLWEYMKNTFDENHTSCTPLQSAICGSVAGGIAAAVTTPLDVAKTRIILTQDVNNLDINPYRVVLAIAKQEGFARIFSGIIPRVTWISVGGFIFLGSYDKAKSFLQTS